MNFFLILICLTLMWSCNKDESNISGEFVDNADIDIRNLIPVNTSTSINKHYAKYLSENNNSIIDPDDGEYLVAHELDRKGGSIDLFTQRSIYANPLLTVAFPSLDYFPNEDLIIHKTNIDYWIFLPQDTNSSQVIAFDNNGTEVLISSDLDRTKRYCIVKQSEEFYAIDLSKSTTFSGNIKPNSLNYFNSRVDVSNFKLYDYIQYYNALALDNGADIQAMCPNCPIDDGAGGDVVDPRTECSCIESDFQRDCDDGKEVLSAVGFTHRGDTWAVESFWHGPNLELRNVYAFYDHGTGQAYPINTGIRTKRRHLTGIRHMEKELLNHWDRSVGGDRSLSHWVEEGRGKSTTLNLKFQPKVEVFGGEVSAGEIGLTVNLSDVNYELGSSLVFYEDDYCDDGTEYKVWFGNEGYFFFNQSTSK